MLATPHRKDVTELSSVQHIRDLTAKLQRRIHDENIPLTLTLGMENHIDDALPEDAAGRQSPHHERLALHTRRNALLRQHSRARLRRRRAARHTSARINARLRPPGAHRSVSAATRIARTLHQYGHAQPAHARQPARTLGEEVRQFSLDLLRQGMAHIISSDTHSPHPPRTPELGEALKIATEIVGWQKAKAMVNDTPRAILEDTRLIVPSPLTREG